MRNTNPGKDFEVQFKKSVNPELLCYRLPDPVNAFNKSNLRFSLKNPFDYLVWNSEIRTLFALELKSVAGNAISFERDKDQKGEIHYHQIEGLKKWSAFGVEAGFLIEFRKSDFTFFLPIKEYLRLVSNIPNKKSFNINDLETYSINIIYIPQKKLKIHYYYDLRPLFGR